MSSNLLYSIATKVLPTKASCFSCGHKGRQVDIFTVRSLVLPEFIDLVKEDRYYFCNHSDCPVVYFGTSPENVIGKESLKTRVGLKEKDAPHTREHS